MHSFSKLGLDTWIQKTCVKVGYQQPTKIQELAIPQILKKKCVIANAETGSGKTATFAFPILQELAKDPHGVFAVILTANRELAMQISEQFTIFGSSLNLKVATLVGGIDFSKQSQELERIPHIIVGTPGRSLDMISKSELLQGYLENVKYLVLDEADRLFEESIIDDITKILKYIPQEKQVILATATITNDFNDNKISEILGMKLSFERFCVNNQKKVVQTLKQKYALVPEMVKDQNFIHLLSKFQGISMIIFVNKCRTCHCLNALLRQLEFESTALHSGLKQGERIAHLKNFKNQVANILVATDVASRGLDIPTVDLVINYDIPKNPDDYIHRVGRTARKGKRGLAISFMTQYDVQLVLAIEKRIEEKLEEMKLDEEQALEIATKINKAKKQIKIRMSEDGTSERFDQQEEEKKTYKQHLRDQREEKKASKIKDNQIVQEE